MKAIDKITNLIQKGMTNDEIFAEISFEASAGGVLTKNDKQYIADCIVQIRDLDVFAKGEIPKETKRKDYV